MSTTQTGPVAPLVEHFFRHKAGRLVGLLTRIDRELIDRLQSFCGS
jgi:hypothetical protein